MTEQPVVLRYRDFFFPQRLLEQTGALENPLLVYSLRRSRRWWRRLLLHVFEVVLLVVGFACVHETNIFHAGGARRIHLIPLTSLTGSGAFLSGLSLTLTFWALAFLLLRYHLMLNDQSHHLKALRKNYLQQLLLTHLRAEDYFLHHLLYFCLRYRVLVAFTAIVSVEWLIQYFSYNADLLTTRYYATMIWGLSVVLLSWVVGVWQYLLEYRLLAGRPRTFVSMTMPWLLSLALAGGTVLLAYVPAMLIAELPLLAILLTVAMFLIAAWFAFAYGRWLHFYTMDILHGRLQGKDPDWLALKKPVYRPVIHPAPPPPLNIKSASRD